ncbi:hypothetical protein J2X68_001369 [Streptomyces sp. 3330]|uniref:hypothetical protein n=1 Tax=Streptomyces sp. 3330 TaxID=2817755 RepID=UPI00286766E7|nr:hypothetical protein [Streptomyces sp. 3330]MDR6974691.1 hypothetical protein [Streptomyces sp. 3330]
MRSYRSLFRTPEFTPSLLSFAAFAAFAAAQTIGGPALAVLGRRGERQRPAVSGAGPGVLPESAPAA